jgi:OPA family glycerol-3-phosphate transporter-like MFS transporter
VLGLFAEVESMAIENTRLLRWQILTITLMVVGYSGYYFCRSNFSVMLPQLIAELTAKGASAADAKIRLGMIASLGVFGYAIGKFVCGSVSDFLGGRRSFLYGMLGAVGFTVLFALGGGMPIFTFAWIGNRLFQSLGWVGMIKLTSRWFSYSTYGAAVGVISLSYLFGDALSRQFMSILIAHGLGWRAVFLIAAATLLSLFVLNFFLLRDTPEDIGEKEPPSNSSNLFADQTDQTKVLPFRQLLRTLLQSREFWVVCALSLGCTLVRETFNTWTPTYFTEFLGLSQAEAASKSSWFPFFGGVSVLVAGFASDVMGKNGRATIIVFGLLLTGVALVGLGQLDPGTGKYGPICLVALVAFLMMGPYSYLSGAIALDFGGKQGSATTCGIIDGIGYLGGYLAGGSMAKISVVFGWRGAFFVLAGIAWLSSFTAALFLLKLKPASLRAADQVPFEAA